MDLQHAVQLFLGEQRPTTRTSYQYVLNNMTQYVGPQRPIERVSTTDLLEYMQGIRSRNLAPATDNKYIKTIKTFFNWLVKAGYLQESPAAILRQPRLPAYVTRDKAMPDDKLAIVLDYAQWRPRDYALILFLADTGCRRTGAATLQVKDLMLDQQRAYVTEKGDKTRLVAYGSECSKALRRWLDIRIDEGPYVFHRRGNAIKPAAISQIFRRACIAAGVGSYGSHSLRHRKGHQLADARVAPSVAATALGHSDPSITFKHYYPADWESAEKELRSLSIHRSTANVTPSKPYSTSSSEADMPDNIINLFSQTQPKDDK